MRTNVTVTITVEADRPGDGSQFSVTRRTAGSYDVDSPGERGEALDNLIVRAATEFNNQSIEVGA